MSVHDVVVTRAVGKDEQAGETALSAVRVRTT
jgi:hypothetical protein